MRTAAPALMAAETRPQDRAIFQASLLRAIMR
jgi:hypothetical protein